MQPLFSPFGFLPPLTALRSLISKRLDRNPMHIHYRAGNHIRWVINEGESEKEDGDETLHVNRILTGVLSCWLGTPLLSDAANGFIMKKCSPG